MGKVFRKAFRILGLDERKGRWVVEQDFHGNFQVNVTWFFAFFSSVLDWIVLILVWFERSLHSAPVSGQSWPWPLELMTSRGVERTWIRTGGYGRFRGEWVKTLNKLYYYWFKIFPQFWLAKSTCIIHHNQVLMTKFGNIFQLINKWHQKRSFLTG